MKKNKAHIFAKILLVAFVVFFIIFIANVNDLIFVEAHSVSNTIEIEVHNVGTRYMSQTISFENNEGNQVVISGLFEGDTDTNTVYVYRIGRWEWMTPLRMGYKFLVSDKPID